MVGQLRDDAIHASRSRRCTSVRIADQDFLAAGRLDRGFVRPHECDRVDELVLLAVVGVVGRKAFREVVVEKRRAEDVL